MVIGPVRAAPAAETSVGCRPDDAANAAELRAAITAADAAGSGDVALAEGCTYTLTSNDGGPGHTSPTGLPVITGSVRIAGNGAVVRRGHAPGTRAFRLFEVAAGGDLTLRGVVLRNGDAAGGSGGAVLVRAGGGLTVSQSVLDGNHADWSGGAILGAGARVTVLDTTLSRNSALSAGGALLVVGKLSISRSHLVGNRATSGGAVGALLGTLTIRDSLLSANAARGPGGAIDNEFGTAVVSGTTMAGNAADSGGGVYNTGALVLADSTVTGNAAAVGAGVFNHHDRAAIVNATLAGNRASVAGDGGAVYNEGGAFRITNSILDANGGGSCNDRLGTPVTDGGHDLVFPLDDVSCPATFAKADPRLGPLADNGGPTPTMRLHPRSAAVDTADDAVCATAVDLGGAGAVDQRGVPRPQGAHCDIGAFELDAPDGVDRASSHE